MILYFIPSFIMKLAYLVNYISRQLKQNLSVVYFEVLQACQF